MRLYTDEALGTTSASPINIPSGRQASKPAHWGMFCRQCSSKIPGGTKDFISIDGNQVVELIPIKGSR